MCKTLWCITAGMTHTKASLIFSFGIISMRLLFQTSKRLQCVTGELWPLIVYCMSSSTSCCSLNFVSKFHLKSLGQLTHILIFSCWRKVFTGQVPLRWHDATKVNQIFPHTFLVFLFFKDQFLLRRSNFGDLGRSVLKVFHCKYFSFCCIIMKQDKEWCTN